jgi:hypothetical protein
MQKSHLAQRQNLRPAGETGLSERFLRHHLDADEKITQILEKIEQYGMSGFLSGALFKASNQIRRRGRFEMALSGQLQNPAIRKMPIFKNCWKWRRGNARCETGTAQIPQNGAFESGT